MNIMNDTNLKQPNAEENKEVDDNDYYKSTDKGHKQEMHGDDKENEMNDKIIKDGRNSDLYNEKLLKKYRRQHFITIPQTKQNHQQLYDNLLKTSKCIKYLLVAKEAHTNGGDHYHILITGTQGIRISAIHKRIMATEGDIKGSINYQEVKTLKASETYCKKDGNYKEQGEIETQKYVADTRQATDDTLDEIYSNDKTLEENLAIIKAKHPTYYTDKYENILARLQEKDNKPMKHWDLPEYNTQNTTLKPYQAKIWKLINEAPKQRRIIWVNGKPNTGKSFMFNYIEQNYDYGIYNAGSTASLDNAVYGYEGQGAIAWDIPKSFDFTNLGDHLASVIEKFSDFGQSLTSKKYKGKKVRVAGHVIVFSNRSPLAQLAHRDIVEINTRDDETEEQRLATWKTRKVKHKITGEWQYEVSKDTAHHGTERSYYTYEALPPHIKQDVYGDDNTHYDSEDELE